MYMEFFKVFVAGASVEALWQTLKMFWQDGKMNINNIATAILGIFICLYADIDFFKLVGLEFSVPIVGLVLSGLIVSRGANFIHDFLATLENFKTNMQ